ncbi:MAG: helix-turn-helix domain-containing protein [Alphaproteobacteria bacterium]|jgi:CRP/FNR family transcriptional regulator|nr:helix-turn-helix domain-containing protein [Alphaproteobacteria bacterium]
MPIAETDWRRAFPALADLEPAAAARLAGAAETVRLPAGAAAFRPGDACHAYLMVLDGTVKVATTADSGREIVLYRVGPGETCVLTTSCLMAAADYEAEGIAETPVAALALPRGAFRDLLTDSRVFRDFVFSAFGSRLTGLLALIQEVAFQRIDRRLARLLLARGAAGGAAGDAIVATHHDLAVELGSAREVISRQLKEFERRGAVALGRGQVRVVDAAALARLAEDVG